jgi:hypothetical protein
MALTSKCGVCPRSSSVGDGWWAVHDYKTDPPTVYDLCPSCYRNKSLLAYRDTLLEAIDAILMSHSNPDEKMGMELMKNRIKSIVRDTTFND